MLNEFNSNNDKKSFIILIRALMNNMRGFILKRNFLLLKNVSVAEPNISSSQGYTYSAARVGLCNKKLDGFH